MWKLIENREESLVLSVSIQNCQTLGLIKQTELSSTAAQVRINQLNTTNRHLSAFSKPRHFSYLKTDIIVIEYTI